MRDYENPVFLNALEQIRDKTVPVVKLNIPPGDLIYLQYFLTKNFYYAVIIDDYPFDITDKPSLLEALYHQAKLIASHDLNWDAITDGMVTLRDLKEFEGVCLLFRHGILLQNKISDQFKILEEIVSRFNDWDERKRKRFTLVLNGSVN
jgi:hypothetical protein